MQCIDDPLFDTLFLHKLFVFTYSHCSLLGISRRESQNGRTFGTCTRNWLFLPHSMKWIF